LIGIDTNILLRYVIRDDPKQTARACELMDSFSLQEPGFLTLVTLAELFWVLDRSYNESRSRILQVILAFLANEGLRIENELAVFDALLLYETKPNADFSDCLIACCSMSAGCSAVYTFDRRAARSSGMTILS